jgi:hypothetical protein
MRLTVATLIWDPNEKSEDFSRMYDESWVEKLFAGFNRNLTRPFRFICYTDRPRPLSEAIEQLLMGADKPGYGDCIRPYQLDAPMILVGLDTVITGNIDQLADHCLQGKILALPRDPYSPARACNGVALVPAGNRHIFDDWNGENDMDWVRGRPHHFIDDLFPGQVKSFKVHVKPYGLGDARIVYFHGAHKPHQLQGYQWIDQHWRV